MIEVEHKVGDSLSWAITLKDDVTGTPVNLTGFTVTSQFRTLSGTLIATAVITIANQGTNPGEFTLVIADGNVFRDAPKPVFTDIQFVDGGGLTTSSDLIKLKLIQDITV